MREGHRKGSATKSFLLLLMITLDDLAVRVSHSPPNFLQKLLEALVQVFEFYQDHDHTEK